MSNNKPVIILGDIHGAFDRLVNQVTRIDISSCYLICVGDLGIGFNYPSDGELRACNKLNDFFAARDIQFMSIRGNHDNPAYFNGSKRIELSHLKLLSDYHTETLNGEKYFFVGGAVSIDRVHRIPDRSWWADEKFIYDESKVMTCDVLITHSGPTYVGPFDKQGLSGWIQQDPLLWDICYAERIAHNQLIENCRAKTHYCGHFHCKDWAVSPNGICTSRILDIEEIYEHKQYDKFRN